MTKANIRAYCREEKRWVSDDLVDFGEGLKNLHEHPITLFRQVGKELEPGGTMRYITELTSEAYMRDASRLDAELIVRAIKRVGSQGEAGWALNMVPDGVLNMIATQIIAGLRQVAVEEERKLAKLTEKKKLPAKKACPLPEDEPIV